MTGKIPRHHPKRLTRTDKLAYALPAMPLAVIGIPVYVFLPKFYTDTVGLNISTIGILLMAVRVFDAATDPFIGNLSDKTASPFGRRKPYIGIGALGLALSILFLFRPMDLSGTSLTLYFGFWLFALFFFLDIDYDSIRISRAGADI
jgi:GPH family glycoside/pentoside/hexuronide:cation symporter